MNRNLTVSINAKKYSQKCRSISSTVKFNSVKLKNINFCLFHSLKFSPSKNFWQKRNYVFLFRKIVWQWTHTNFIPGTHLRYVSYLNWYMVPVATKQLCFLEMQCGSLVSGCIILRLVRTYIQFSLLSRFTKYLVKQCFNYKKVIVVCPSQFYIF